MCACMCICVSVCVCVCVSVCVFVICGHVCDSLILYVSARKKFIQQCFFHYQSCK